MLPLSLLTGAGFLVLADTLARTVLSPAELPIGVVTAFVGAPVFVWILRSTSHVAPDGRDGARTCGSSRRAVDARRHPVAGGQLRGRGGGWLALIGPNGAGKSTLMRAMAGLVPSPGPVTLGGADARTLKARDRARLLAYVPQEPVLPPDLTVASTSCSAALRTWATWASPASATGSAPAPLDRLDVARFAGGGWPGCPAVSGSGWCSPGPWRRAQRAAARRADLVLDLGHEQQVLELVDGAAPGRGLTVVSTLHDLTWRASTPTSSSAERRPGGGRGPRPRCSPPT